MKRSAFLPVASISLFSLATLAGCASIGPRGIELSRINFNHAIQSTDAEQLLLNIVRQRYNDPVMFLEVASVSSSMSRTANLSLSGLFPTGPGNETYNGGLGGNYSDSPLVFYSPNTGERFVRQILTPIDLRTISLLLQSGWSIERVLLVAGDSFGGFKNAAVGSREFRTVVDHLRTLQRNDQLTFAMEKSEGVDVLAMIPATSALATEAYREICRLIKVPADGRALRVQLGVGERTENSSYIYLATRSLYSSFYFLSNGVDISQNDLKASVIQPRTLAGGVFDAGSDLFRIRVSDSKPDDAAVKVEYRKQWFYIPAADQDSRTTFALLSMMLMLQSGDSARMAPLISLSPTR